jgi:hypothetical protein
VHIKLLFGKKSYAHNSSLWKSYAHNNSSLEEKLGESYALNSSLEEKLCA